MPNIHQELLIGTPAEKIYNSITSAEGLSAWWTPGSTAKPEAGSVGNFPFGPKYHKEMKIVELKQSELVKWKCIEGTSEWIDTSISFQLFPADKKSLLESHPEI